MATKNTTSHETRNYQHLPSSASLLRFCVSLCFLWLTSPLVVFSASGAATKPHPFDAEIAEFEKWDRQNASPTEPILFVGSSSIRLWQTAEAFPDAPVINRGFGGSTIADVNHYFDRVVAKYKPSAIIFYAGDNDIASGKSPQQVFDDFKAFVQLVDVHLPKTPIYFISIKPSIARLKMWPEMKQANALVQQLASRDKSVIFVDVATAMLVGSDSPSKDLFLDDGLHLNAKGYQLWNKALSPVIAEMTKPE
jgi:lysophospholipase L1-like esterase